MAQARRFAVPPPDASGSEGTPAPRRPRPLAKVIAAAVVVAAFAVFGAVLWYAWRESRVLVAGEPPLVKAPEGPWKVPPQEPGGAPIVNESAPIARVLEGRREEEPVRLLQPELPTPQVLERLRTERAGPSETPPSPEPVGGGEPAEGPATVAALPQGGQEQEAAETAAGAPPPMSSAAETGPATQVEEGAAAGAGSGLAAATAETGAPAPMHPPAAGHGAQARPQGAEDAAHAAVGALRSADAAEEAAAHPPAGEPAAEGPRPAEEEAVSLAAAGRGAAEPAGSGSAAGAQAAAGTTAASRIALAAPTAPASTESAISGVPAPAPAAAGPEGGRTSAARTPAASPLPTGPLWRVQLGAYSTERTALSAFAEAKRRHPDLVGEAEPVLVPVEVRGRTLHRLQFGAFASRAEAERVCAAIRARGGDCLVARAGG